MNPGPVRLVFYLLVDILARASANFILAAGLTMPGGWLVGTLLVGQPVRKASSSAAR